MILIMSPVWLQLANFRNLLFPPQFGDGWDCGMEARVALPSPRREIFYLGEINTSTFASFGRKGHQNIPRVECLLCVGVYSVLCTVSINVIYLPSHHDINIPQVRRELCPYSTNKVFSLPPLPPLRSSLKPRNIVSSQKMSSNRIIYLI